MNVSKTTVNSLFSSTKKYRIPIYQRHYVWEKRNWEALWKDIEQTADLRLNDENNAKEHFTGAIVIQPNTSDIEIIDGQQRLTTLQILLCAIRDTCGAFNDIHKIADKLHEQFIQNQPARMSRLSNLSDATGRYKLLPREGSDRDAFQSLVERKIDESSGLIRDAYDYFKDAIEGYVGENYGKLYNLYLSILDGFTFSDIEVDPTDEPEKIFQTINGTGRALDEFDLLRSDLFLRAKTGKKRKKFYAKSWSQFEEDLEFWRKPGVVDKFLETFLRIKLRKKFHHGISLFDQYQDYYKDLSAKLNLDETDNQLLEYVFSELKRYADVYQDICDPKSENKKIKSLIIQFQNMDLYEDLPVELFILCLINEFRLPISTLLHVLDFLESYVMRKKLCYYSRDTGAKAVRRVFLDLIDEKQEFSLVNFICQLSGQMPSDGKLKSGLHQLRTEKNGKRPKSIRVWNAVRHIFEELEDDICVSELFERFRKRWLSAEATLQYGFKGGLPIVYSRMPISGEADSRLENYKFMTYRSGLVKLSEYEIVYNSDNRTVRVIGSDNNEKTWEEEPLFAFPAGSELKPYETNEINANQKDIEDIAVKDSVKEWLQLYVNDRGNSEFEHRLLKGINATVVTRTGHVLQGTLKSFNADAIYMQINAQIVAIYMSGLYELNTAKMVHSKPRKFMTYDGLIELAKYEIYQNKLIGTDPDGNSNGKIVRDINEILFDFPADAKSEPYQQTCDYVETEPMLGKRRNRLRHKLAKLRTAKDDSSNVTIVTHGYMFQGKITEVNRISIEMKVEKLKVNVYLHGVSRISTDSATEDKKPFKVEDLVRSV